MKSTPRLALLVAGLTLPVAAVLAGYVFAEGQGPPRAPVEVRVGSSAGPEPSSSGPTQPVETTAPPTLEKPPAHLPPPPPDDDEPDDADDALPDDD